EPQRMRMGEKRAWHEAVVGARVGRAAVEQGHERDAEGIGDLRQAGGAAAVRALFVFLDLLERQADPRTKLGLREPLLQAADADVLADQDVDRTRVSFRHDMPLECLQSRSRANDSATWRALCRW